jgi:carbonic anhydrase
MSDEVFRPNTDELLSNNDSYVREFSDHGLSLAPARHLAIVACMDSRMDIFQMLGLAHGDAHVIRNAGGVVTDDVERSLVLSQRLLNTREIVLIHHTDCGLQKVNPTEFKDELQVECGLKPAWSIESFTDPFEDTLQSMNRLHHSPFIKFKDYIRGFVYDVANGKLIEVHR